MKAICMTKRHFILDCIITINLFFWLPLNNQQAKAQISNMPIIELTYPIYNLSWSPDGQSIVFQSPDTGLTTSIPSWYQYNITTSQLLPPVITWPFQPKLTLEQITDFKIGTDVGGGVSFIFRSPNGRYIAYASDISDDYHVGRALGIVDMQTSEHKFIGNMALGGNGLAQFGDYLVIWSPDSSAFTVHNGGGPASFDYFVTNFSSSVMSATAMLLDSGLPSSRTNGGTYTALDVGSAGKRLLMDAGLGLTIWNTEDVTKTFTIPLPGENIIGAIFLASNPSIIRYASRIGIAQYDVVTGTKTILNNTLNYSSAYSAWFSPDGNNVVILVNTSPTSYQLYLVDLHSYPQPTAKPSQAFSLNSINPCQYEVRGLAHVSDTACQRQHNP